MIKPTKTLKNPYYFINNNVVYKISNSNDSDECGEKKVVLTEDKKTNWAASAAIFPSFKVSYTVDSETVDVYYFLQDLIIDGDKFVGNKFVHQHPKKDEEGQSTTPLTYQQLFDNSVQEDIEKYADRGYTLDRIKQLLPSYVFAVTGEEQAVSFRDNDGKLLTGTMTGVTGITTYTEAQITELIYETLNQKAKDYTNGLLKPHKMQLKDSVEIVVASNIEEIPQQTQEANTNSNTGGNGTTPYSGDDATGSASQSDIPSAPTGPETGH